MGKKPKCVNRQTGKKKLERRVGFEGMKFGIRFLKSGVCVKQTGKELSGQPVASLRHENTPSHCPTGTKRKTP